MKKALISTIAVFASQLILLSLLAACSTRDPVKQIAGEYNQLREQNGRGRNMTEEQQESKDALRYAQLFKKIANGSVEREKEYAELLITITENTIEFNENEVFTLAEDLAKIYTDIAEGNDDFGVQKIKVIEDTKELTIIIDYIDIRGYSVRPLDEDKMEYSGEQLVEYDGSLGEHRIEITFYDASASERFAEQYPIWATHDIKEVPAYLGVKLKLKGVYSPDHAFVLYIGSDEPISIDEQDFMSLNRPMGSIELIIRRVNLS